MEATELEQAAQSLTSATSTAVLWPPGGAGFEQEAFLRRLEELCRDPACAMGEAGLGALRDLVASHLEACAWVLSTSDRIDSGTIYWHGHCSEWFLQPSAGSCLRILHVAGESC